MKAELRTTVHSGCQAHLCWEACISVVQWSRVTVSVLACLCTVYVITMYPVTHTSAHMHTNTALQGDAWKRCGSLACGFLAVSLNCFPPETIHPLCSLVYLLSYCTNPRWHYFRLEPYLSTQWNCFDFVFKKYEFYVHLTEPIIFCYSHTYWQVKVSKMRQLSGVFHV